MEMEMGLFARVGVNARNVNWLCSKTVCNIFKPVPFLSVRIPDKRTRSPTHTHSHTHTQSHKPVTLPHTRCARAHINAIILRIRSMGGWFVFFLFFFYTFFRSGRKVKLIKMINENNKLHNIIKKCCLHTINGN